MNRTILNQKLPLASALDLRERGQYAEALEIMNRYIQAGSVETEALALRCQLLLLLNALPEALAALDQALAASPGHPALLRNLARYQLRQGQSAEALSSAHTALQTSQGDIEDAAVLASALGANGRHVEALNLIDQVLQHMPVYAEALATRAMLRFQSGNAAGAYDDAGAALQLKPFMFQLWPVYARLAVQLGHKTQAREALQHCLVRDPDNLAYMVNLGELHRDAGSYEQAISVLLRALELAPENPSIHQNLGVAFQADSQVDKAEVHYRKVLELNPGSRSVRCLLAQLLRIKYQYNESLKLFSELVREQPNDAVALSNLGVLQSDCKRYKEAVISLKAAIAFDNSIAEAHAALANVFRATGQMGEAKESAHQALALDSNSASIRHTLGNILKETGDLEGASNHYRHALVSDPNSYPGLASAVTLAILAYLSNEYTESERLLQCSHALMEKRDSLSAPSRVYWRYLKSLLNVIEKNNDFCDADERSGVLEVIGESHSLSVHHVQLSLHKRSLVARAHWVEGSKLWHLGRSEDNRFKLQFCNAMLELPFQSNVLICIGEIDCRWDSPIMSRLVNVEQCESVAKLTIVPALDFMIGQALKGKHKLIISGIPACQAKLPEDESLSGRFISMLNEFNLCLKKESLARGMGFLDVFALTDNGDGRSNGKWHIDSYHLHPNAWKEAFSMGYLHGLSTV